MTDPHASQADSRSEKQPKLLEETRRILRLHHYSIHTERSYVDWIVRFVRFHRMERREEQFKRTEMCAEKETLRRTMRTQVLNQYSESC